MLPDTNCGPPPATIRSFPVVLRALPPASTLGAPGLYPWSPVSTSALMAALQCDRGNWTTWRNRGLTPPPLPQGWFKRTVGQPLTYRVDHVRAWLASRRGEPYDALDDWREGLRTNFGAETTDPAEVRRLAAVYARAAGPVVNDVSFNPSGFASYLASLSGGTRQ